MKEARMIGRKEKNYEDWRDRQGKKTTAKKKNGETCKEKEGKKERKNVTRDLLRKERKKIERETMKRRK